MYVHTPQLHWLSLDLDQCLFLLQSNVLEFVARGGEEERGGEQCMFFCKSVHSLATPTWSGVEVVLLEPFFEVGGCECGLWYWNIHTLMFSLTCVPCAW